MWKPFPWQEVVQSPRPLSLVCCTDRELDNLYPGADPGHISVRVVRGERAGDKDQLFHEMAAALQFPYYFGVNWDALNDVLGDLD